MSDCLILEDKEFQFHKGAIKTFVYIFDCNRKIFQFHKGAIKTSLIMLLMVCILIFQFHKGAIKTNFDFQK